MGGGDWIEQQQIIQGGYDALPNQPQRTVREEIASDECLVAETVQLPKPDLLDSAWITLRANSPDPITWFILLGGIYGALHKPINFGLKKIFGVNIDDVHYLVKRREERDKELNQKDT